MVVTPEYIIINTSKWEKISSFEEILDWNGYILKCRYDAGFYFTIKVKKETHSYISQASSVDDLKREAISMCFELYSEDLFKSFAYLC